MSVINGIPPLQKDIRTAKGYIPAGTYGPNSKVSVPYAGGANYDNLVSVEEHGDGDFVPTAVYGATVTFVNVSGASKTIPANTKEILFRYFA